MLQLGLLSPTVGAGRQVATSYPGTRTALPVLLLAPVGAGRAAAGVTGAMEVLHDTYSLWLEPRGAVADTLRREIAAQAANGSPIFEPHITLLGGVRGDLAQLQKTCEDLAQSTQVCLVAVMRVYICACAWQGAQMLPPLRAHCVSSCA